MNKTILTLCTLTSIAAFAIAIGVSRNPDPSQKTSSKGQTIAVEPADESSRSHNAPPVEQTISEEVASAFHKEINQQLLRHIAPEVSMANHFSRTLTPENFQSYEALLLAGGGRILDFEVIHVDNLKASRETAATGKYNSESKEILLWDDAEDAFVPVGSHPLMDGVPGADGTVQKSEYSL